MSKENQSGQNSGLGVEISEIIVLEDLPLSAALRTHWRRYRITSRARRARSRAVCGAFASGRFPTSAAKKGANIVAR
jgi:hypothetical protein